MSAVLRFFVFIGCHSLHIPGEGEGKAVLVHAMMACGGGGGYIFIFAHF
jgi:hypothetical protein